MTTKSSNLITSFQAAEILGITPDYVRRLISYGKIKATKLGNNWLINRNQLGKIKRIRFPRSKELESNGSDQR